MLTCVILAKNEEDTIEKAIESVKFADEILVVDDNSTDNTALTAAKAGATILTHTLNDDFAAQRNYALEKASGPARHTSQGVAGGDWVLYLDADEVVADKLAKEIKKIVKKTGSEVTSYYIKRRDTFWGRELRYGELRKSYSRGIIRLVKKNSGTWYGIVHEEFKPHGKVDQLQGYITHTPHQSVAEFLNDINVYSSLRTSELYKQGKKSSVFSILFYPFGKFIYTYFWQLGLLDGPPGFVYSFMMSFHSFLVRAKLYMLWQKQNQK